MDIPLAQPIITDEMVDEAERVLREEFFLRGESVTAFEERFAEYVGTEAAIAVSSGTDALFLSLSAMDIGDGDSVVTTPATFISTANAIVKTGAEPVFVDIDMDTYTIDIDKIADVLDKRSDVAAVLPVHLYGYPVDIERIHNVSGDIPVLSDACQSHGAKLRGERTGSMADVGTFSFYPSKNMTVAGDGGMVTTNDTDIADLVRSLRDVGRGDGAYEHPRIGYTARMNTINAAIGKEQLKYLDEWNKKRQAVADIYDDILTDVDEVTLPPRSPNRDQSWYLYVIRTDQRDVLQSALAEAGIQTGIHYQTPVHLHPPYQNLGHQRGEFPKTERWANEVLSLPMHPQLTEEEAVYVAEAIVDFYQ